MAQNQQYFWFQGLSTGGKSVEYLTQEDLQNFIKQERELEKQQETDKKLDPAMNEEVRKWGQGNAAESGIFPQEIQSRQATAQVEPQDEIMSGLDSIASSKEDTSEIESVLAKVPSRNDPSGLQTGVSQGASMQGRGSVESLLDDLPEEVTKRLVFEFHNGTLTSSQLLKEIQKSQESMVGIRQAQEKKKYETDESMRAKGQELSSLEKRNTEDAETDIRVAQINSASDRYRSDATKANAYSQRTFALKPAQINALTEMDNSTIELQGIGNLLENKFVGPLKGRVGSAKNFAGLLGKEEKTFRSAYEGFKNALLKIRSGAAVTDNEMKRIVNELPSMNDSPKQFRAAFNKQMIALRNTKSNYIQALQKSGYDVQGWGADVQPIETYEDGLPDQNTRSQRSNQQQSNTPPSYESPKVDQQLVQRAQMALNDPDATPEEKAQAQKILNAAGVR